MEKQTIDDEDATISLFLQVAGLKALFHFLQKLFTLLQNYQQDNGNRGVRHWFRITSNAGKILESELSLIFL